MFYLYLLVAIVLLSMCVYFIGAKYIRKKENVVSSKLSGKSELLFFQVKGIYYRTSIEQARCKQLKIGESLQMVPEPKNRYDSHAIRIETTDGVHVGYVPREKAQQWFDCLDEFSNCKVRNISNQGETKQIEVVVCREEKEWRIIVRHLMSEDVKLRYSHSSSEISQALNLEQLNPIACLNAWSNLLREKPNDIFIEYHYLMALGYAHRANEAADYAKGFIERHRLEEWKDLVEYESYWRRQIR